MYIYGWWRAPNEGKYYFDSNTVVISRRPRGRSRRALSSSEFSSSSTSRVRSDFNAVDGTVAETLTRHCAQSVARSFGWTFDRINNRAKCKISRHRRLQQPPLPPPLPPPPPPPPLLLLLLVLQPESMYERFRKKRYLF